MENKDFDKMGRRRFLSASTMSLLGYSFMVSIPAKADDAAGDSKAGITPLGKKIEKSLGGKPFDLAGEPNMEKIEIDCDVLVAGGGLAGVCAAIAAARSGAKTVLVQDRSRLDGNSSSEIRIHSPRPFYCPQFFESCGLFLSDFQLLMLRLMCFEWF